MKNKNTKDSQKKEHIYVDIYLEEKEDKDVEINDFFELLEKA